MDGGNTKSKTQVFDFVEEGDDGGAGSPKGRKGLKNPHQRRGSTHIDATMTRGSIGRQNLNAARDKLAQGGAKPAPTQQRLWSKAFVKKEVRQGAEEPTTGQTRASKRLAESNKVGEGNFFGRFGAHFDGPRKVPVNTRTVGTAVEGKHAKKLRDLSDDEVAEISQSDRNRKNTVEVQGAVAASQSNGANGRVTRKRDEERNSEVEPDSEEDSKDVFGNRYARKPDRRKDRAASAEKDAQESMGNGTRKGGWKARKRRALEGDEGGGPAGKRGRALQQGGPKQEKDPEYKPTSRCAVLRAPSNARAAKPEVQVINLDSEDTPQKEKPETVLESQEGAPRKLVLNTDTAGPSSMHLNQDHLFRTGRCWLGTFAANGCTVYFDALRLQVTVPPEYVKGGAETMTFSWDLEELAPGKSFLMEVEDSPSDAFLLVFRLKSEVHPALTSYLDLRSKDVRSCTVRFELDKVEWKARLRLDTWPAALKEHFNKINSEEVTKYTDGAPSEKTELLDPKAEQRQRAAALASQHYRPSRHQKPVIQTFHFPANDPDAVTISTSDLARLEPLEFLNDTLIDFYIKFLQIANLADEHAGRIHIVNSFFYKKLTETAQEARKRGASREEAFRRMNKWTRKVDIFTKDFVIVPVNQSLHWSLAIIVYPGGGDAANGKLEGSGEPRTPCILQLDSMAGGHTNVEDLLRQYLSELWLATHPDEMRPPRGEHLSRFSKSAMPFLQLKVPQQDNHCDCGLFLLHYVEHFIAEPPKTFNFRSGNGRKGYYRMTPDWFSPGEASVKRTYLRNLVISLANHLAQGNVSILERDALRALWIEATDDGRNTGLATRNRGGVERDRNTLPEKEPRKDGANALGGKRLRKEGKGRPVEQSVYDDELEGPAMKEETAELRVKERKGVPGAKIPDALMAKALKEEPTGGAEMENPLSVDLETTPLKRKRGLEAGGGGGNANAADGSGAAGWGSSEETTDPLWFYRRPLPLPGTKAEAMESARTHPPGKAQAGSQAAAADDSRTAASDVSRAANDDPVPDSEGEEEAVGRHAGKRARSELQGNRGGAESSGEGDPSEGPQKRARSEGPAEDLGRCEDAMAGRPGPESAAAAGNTCADAQYESAPGKGRLVGDFATSSSSDSDRDGLEGARNRKGSSEGETRQPGLEAEWQKGQSEAELAASGGVGEGGEEGGGEEQSGLEMVVHPVAGVLHEVEDLGGTLLSDHGEDVGADTEVPQYQAWSEREGSVGAPGGNSAARGPDDGVASWEGGEDRGRFGDRGPGSGDRFEGGSDAEGGLVAVLSKGERSNRNEASSPESSEEYGVGQKAAHWRSGGREPGVPTRQSKASLKKEIEEGVMRAVNRAPGGASGGSGPEEMERGLSEEPGVAENPGTYGNRWAGGWEVEKDRPVREDGRREKKAEGLAAWFEEEAEETDEKGGEDLGRGASAGVTGGPVKWGGSEDEVQFLGEVVRGLGGVVLSGQRGVKGENSNAYPEVPAQGGPDARKETHREIFRRMKRPQEADLGRPVRGVSDEVQGALQNLFGKPPAGIGFAGFEEDVGLSKGWIAATQARTGQRKLDVLTAKAKERLFNGPSEASEREAGHGEGLATEARVLLEGPAGSADEGGANPGLAESPRKAAVAAEMMDHEPLSQEFTDGDDLEAGRETESWEAGDSGGEERGRETSDRGMPLEEANRATLAGRDGVRDPVRPRRLARSSLENDPKFKAYREQGRRDDEAEGSDEGPEARGNGDWPDAEVQGVPVPGGGSLRELPGSAFPILPLGGDSFAQQAPAELESHEPVSNAFGQLEGLDRNSAPSSPGEDERSAAEDDDECTIVSAPARAPLFGAPGHQGTRTGATKPGSGPSLQSPRNGEMSFRTGAGDERGGRASETAGRFAKELAKGPGKPSLVQTGAVIRREGGQVNGARLTEKGGPDRDADEVPLTGSEALDLDHYLNELGSEGRQGKAAVRRTAESGDSLESAGKRETWGSGASLRDTGREHGFESSGANERSPGSERKGPRLSDGAPKERFVPECEDAERIRSEKLISFEELMQRTASQEEDVGASPGRGSRPLAEDQPEEDDVSNTLKRRSRARTDGSRHTGNVGVRRMDVVTIDLEEEEEEERVTKSDKVCHEKRNHREHLGELKHLTRAEQLMAILEERELSRAPRVLSPV